MKKYYHCEISFQKPSYFIGYSSDTRALITATLAHYISHLNLTLSIDQRIELILFCIATCIWQRCSSLSVSSHNGSAPLVTSLFISTAISRALPCPDLLTVHRDEMVHSSWNTIQLQSPKFTWSDFCEILDKRHHFFFFFSFKYVVSNSFPPFVDN